MACSRHSGEHKHTSVSFEKLYSLGVYRHLCGHLGFSDTDYLPLKDTSVNVARLLFSLKRTEYLITLIYRMLLSKASCYLAVTDSLA